MSLVAAKRVGNGYRAGTRPVAVKRLLKGGTKTRPRAACVHATYSPRLLALHLGPAPSAAPSVCPGPARSRAHRTGDADGRRERVRQGMFSPCKENRQQVGRGRPENQGFKVRLRQENPKGCILYPLLSSRYVQHSKFQSVRVTEIQ